MNQLLRSVLFIVAVGAVGAACDVPGGQACPAIAAANFNITVVDAVTSQRICDATIVATETSTGSTMNLMAFGSGADCGYSGGFYERPGTFSLAASKTGYLTTTHSGVVITKGVCNINPVTLTLKLGK